MASKLCELEQEHTENKAEECLITCISSGTMKALFELKSQNTLCDATITLDDGTVFNIHRVILSSCSEHFWIMFNTKFNAGMTNYVLRGIRTNVMQKIIDFSYLKKCDIDSDVVFELFTISDYLQINGLMRLCKEFMLNMLLPENCIQILRFVRARSINDMCVKVFQAVLRNFAQVAKHNNEIVKIPFDTFYEIISHDMLNTKDESIVWECCLRWIGYDFSNRIKYLTKLMGGIRLGLLSSAYLTEKVQNHPYVVRCEALTRPIITEAFKFLDNLDSIYTITNEMQTPDIAIPRIPHDIIFTIGGWHAGPLQFIETYDTRADRWIRCLHEDQMGPRAYHGTAVIGFKIYCIGGYDGRNYFNTCSVFDANNKTWSEIAPMHDRRCYVSVVKMEGFIYAMGGYDGHVRLRTCERYDPTTNQWTIINEMNERRSDADACSLNGIIYITGGFNGIECLNTVEHFIPELNEWQLITPMLSRRSGLSCIGFSKCVYVFGGFNGISRLKVCERYDPEKHEWHFINEMYNPRSNFAIEIIDDMIFVIAGYNGNRTIPHTECYVVESDEWLEATDINLERSGLSASIVTGLPNVKEYAYQNRDQLIEERRLRIHQSNDF